MNLERPDLDRKCMELMYLPWRRLVEPDSWCCRDEPSSPTWRPLGRGPGERCAGVGLAGGHGARGGAGRPRRRHRPGGRMRLLLQQEEEGSGGLRGAAPRPHK